MSRRLVYELRDLAEHASRCIDCHLPSLQLRGRAAEKLGSCQTSGKRLADRGRSLSRLLLPFTGHGRFLRLRFEIGLHLYLSSLVSQSGSHRTTI